MDYAIEHRPSENESYGNKHSGLGIASFLIAAISIVGIIGSSIAIVIAFGDTIQNPKMIQPEDPFAGNMAGVVAAAFGMIFFVILAFIGAVLGAIGLFQKEGTKLFPVLGTVFNTLVVGGVLILTALVIATGNRV